MSPSMVMPPSARNSPLINTLLSSVPEEAARELREEANRLLTLAESVRLDRHTVRWHDVANLKVL